MNFSDQDIITGVLKGDLRSVARLISLSENQVPRARSIQAKLFCRTGRAQTIGITGSPGAGKSTLVDQLADLWRSQGKKVGILAIDPSSPFSGGAILGDRIRMAKAALHPEIFIRSMATRGSLGGLSRATFDAVQILDAAGFDIIIIETVGVGQGEVDVIRTADTVLVVLVPGMGDSVQIIKAGILEIADLFIVNKADRDGADHLQKDLRILMSLTELAAEAWQPPIVRTVATTGQGSADVIKECQAHGQWLLDSPIGRNRKKMILETQILKLANDILLEQILEKKVKTLEFENLLEDCLSRKIDPYSVVQRLLPQLKISP